MGDFGFSELFLIAVIAIVIYGKDLPQAARKISRLYGKLTRQVRDLRDEIQRQIPPDTNVESPTPPPPEPRSDLPSTRPDDEPPEAK